MGMTMANRVLTEQQTAGASAQESQQPTAFGGLETREHLTDAQTDGLARGLLSQLTLDEKVD
jgi:hypothetical protein